MAKQPKVPLPRCVLCGALADIGTPCRKAPDSIHSGFTLDLTLGHLSKILLKSFQSMQVIPAFDGVAIVIMGECELAVFAVPAGAPAAERVAAAILAGETSRTGLNPREAPHD